MTPTSIPLTLAVADDPFARCLQAAGQTLQRHALTTLQLNLGKMCNLACHHCHVEAGPGRTEVMDPRTMERILAWFDQHRDTHGIQIADLTGGAPEMNPHFRDMVQAWAERGVHMIDRCNLTILHEDGYEDLPEFFAHHRVEVSASLPCYLGDNVDKQRGKGVYSDSIQALHRLNAVGYGRPGSGLKLDLVYNPVGYGLPPAQQALENDYKAYLQEHFGIAFNSLWTITNMPIKRFEHALRRDGKLEEYMGKLMSAHRAENVGSVMCRSLISVGWMGGVYDCDFNQMMQMPLEPQAFGPGDDERNVESNARKLWEYEPEDLVRRSIRTAAHCFGCTAGAGSSCTGALG